MSVLVVLLVRIFPRSDWIRWECGPKWGKIRTRKTPIIETLYAGTSKDFFVRFFEFDLPYVQFLFPCQIWIYFRGVFRTERSILQEHWVKYRNSTPGNLVDRHSFCIVSSDFPETMQKLYLSTKFSHQQIR